MGPLKESANGLRQGGDGRDTPLAEAEAQAEHDV